MERHWIRLVSGIACLLVLCVSMSTYSQGFGGQQVRDHPRIVAGLDELDKAKERVTSDPILSMWYAQVEQAAGNLLHSAPAEYVLPDGKRLLDTSREVLSRIYTLAFMYHMTSDERYVERAWTELTAVANFPDWNPSHFLDTAEMTHAFAVGYDWLYDAWTPEQRTFLSNTIVTMGLQPALDAYRNSAWWVRDISNWNVVCNAGIAMGAIAVMDEYPELAQKLLESAYDGLQVFLDRLDGFAGSWDEGLHYWNYSMEYLVPLIATFEQAFGSDFGLLDREGVRGAGAFPIYISGPTGMAFHFGDGTVREPNLPVLFWFAQKFDRPEYAQWQLDSLRGRSSTEGRLSRGVWNLLWYPGALEVNQLPLDTYFPGLEVVTMRGSWDDPNSTFVGLKGGDNAAPHGDLDLGTFVLDALGVRWAIELGSDDYNLPGYFDQDKTGQRLGGQRWNYYRKRAEGQNTLVINPSPMQDQDSRAKAPIIGHHFADDEAFAIVDLSSAYGLYGRDVAITRGVAMFDDRRQVIIQDEISASTRSMVWWFMHTDQPINVSQDGRLATLTHGSQRLEARILSPHDARFTIMDAVPFPTSPKPPGQNANAGKRKLAIQVSSSNETRITVLLSPLSQGESLGELPDVMALAEWQDAAVSGTTLWSKQQRVQLRFDLDRNARGNLPLTISIDGIAESQVKEIKVFLDGQVLYSGTELPIGQSIDTSNYPDGDYQLLVQLTTVEGLNISREFPLTIDNRWEVVDPMKAPVNLGILGTVDLSETLEESGGWIYVDDPINLFGDGSRRTPASSSGEYMVWEAPGMDAFELIVFAKGSEPADRLRVYGADNNGDWQSLEYQIVRAGTHEGWSKLVVHGAVNQQFTFFKLVLEADSSPGELQISEVILSGPQAME